MFIDISYPIDENIAIYPGNPTFHMERVQDIEKGDSSNVSAITMGSHTGTHIDAPAHFIKGGAKVDEIPLDYMNGKAKVIDATRRKSINLDLLQGVDIEHDAILLFKTDNSFNWSCDSILDDYVTLTYEAAAYLVSLEKIKLIGIDYLTIERPPKRRADGKSIHRILLSNGILISEALCLKNVSAGDYEFFCFPLRLTGADGCPVRCGLKSQV